MDYWGEVKRIQIKLKSALVTGTAEATDIIDGITGRWGYLFRVENNIYHADSRDNIFKMIAEFEKSGKDPQMAAAAREMYKDAKEYVSAGKLSEDEKTQNASKLEGIVRQLEAEVDAYIARHEGK